MSVGACCQRNPRTATPDDTIRDAAVRMMQENVGALIVNDGHDRPTGIITDRDIVLRCVQRRRDADATPVSAVMSPVVAKAREGTLLSRATRRMGTDGVRRLPVIDSYGKTVGILTYDDALQSVASHLMAAADSIAAQAPPGASVSGTGEIARVGDYAQRAVAIRTDARAMFAVDEMFDHGVGCVVIVDDERVPKGILTDRDVLCRVVAAGLDAQKVRAEDIMSKDVVTVGEATSLAEVLYRAKSHAVRRVPVIDEQGRLAGLVALDDVVAQLEEELAGLVSAVRTELRESRLLAAERRSRAVERL